MTAFNTDLKALIARELAVSPEDILDVRVDWDDGDRYSPTYPSENTTPTFEVSFLLRDVNGTAGWRTMDTAWTLTALLRAVLGIGVS